MPDSKQGHYKALRREIYWQKQEELVVGLIMQVREVDPAMGIRTIYELCQPESIGRDAFISIGIYYGFGVNVFRNKARTTDYTGLLKDYKIRISMCNVVYENAHIERVNGTIKNQYLIHRNITSFQQLKTEVKRAVDTYNNETPHSALASVTPIAFEQQIKER